MAKLDFTRPILAGAAVLFCVLWLLKGCDKPVTPPDDWIAWRDTVQSLKNKLILKDSLISQIQAHRDTEIKKAKQDSSRLSIENRRLSVGYGRSKQQVQELQDSTGRIQAYVAVTDSLLNAKDSLYYQEVGHRIAMDQLYKLEIAQLGQKNVVQQQVSQLLETKVTDLETQNSKLAKQSKRRKSWNNFWKGIAAGATAATAVIILSNQ